MPKLRYRATSSVPVQNNVSTIMPGILDAFRSWYPELYFTPRLVNPFPAKLLQMLLAIVFMVWLDASYNHTSVPPADAAPAAFMCRVT